jgi:CRISPR-associated endoribonuclease Cas2 subtype I-E
MFTVIRAPKLSGRLKGELTSRMLEIEKGLFVGDLDSRFREALWRRLQEEAPAKGAVVCCPDRTALQGMAIRRLGPYEGRLTYEDGLWLSRTDQAGAAPPCPMGERPVSSGPSTLDT